MKTVAQIRGTAVPVDGDNIDTDQIIAGRFVYRPREGGEFGRHFFFDSRFESTGIARSAHPLNDQRFAGANVLLADENFGCGSARPQAVWAVQDYGIKVVVAISYGAIFHGNCVRLGLPPITVDKPIMADLKNALNGAPSTTFAVDLEAQTLTLDDGRSWPIGIDALDRHRLLTGQDDFALTEGYRAELEAFTADYRRRAPWV